MYGFRTLLVFALSLMLAVPASAQFRAKMRTANKQYEIHAFNLAAQSYLEALERRPDDPEALGRLADCYRHLNQMEDAVRYYSQAVRQQDVEKRHYLELGLSLKALGRYDEAKNWFLTYARDVNAMVGNQYARSCDFAKAQLGANAGYAVTQELLNTPSSDFGPVFAGTNQVVYSSARTDLSSATGFDGTAGNNLLVATIGQDRFLTVPYLLRNGYRGTGNQGPVAYSPDGSLVAFTSNNFVDGTRQIPSSGMQLSLFLATVNPNGEWVDVRPFTYNSADYSTGLASFSPDGRALYFASDRPDGFGGYDIYVSYLNGTNSWSTPENLGPIINSPGHELTPFFDGTDLYFSSDWHDGLGGLDVFRAQQVSGRWTQIFHLGAAINSSRDDYGFVFDNTRNLGYVVSNRTGGRGNEDLWRVTRSADNVTLVIRNASDGAPVPGAIVDFVECGAESYTANEQGLYSFQAIEGLNCNLVVRKEGYVSTTVPITTAGAGEQKEVVVNLSKLNETYPGKVVDYATRIPLQGVVIRVTNRNTNSSMEAVSDVNGDYFVALSPYTTYEFLITNPGYQDLNFTLPVEDGNNRNLLGVIGLQPGVGSGGTPTSPVNPAEPQIPSGYAVQVAALGQLNLEPFSNLESVGDVYAVEEGGRYKVRVGVFASRQQAEQALQSAKSRGYRDAFIVQEAGSGSGQSTTPTNPPATSSGGYKVQLGAYSNPQNFDQSRAASLGTIESRRKGSLTLMLVGGISTLDAARTVQQRARNMGFEGAFIVQEDASGQLIKVQ
ncbi:MAG: carboxypeptidase regulatory-like domain-containing protein [Lewinella sp.]|nr:carboxypeptidase regulatory-like domain-containing protein [Lewinella sp.]